MNKLYCINFTRWKQSYIELFLKTEGIVFFISSIRQGLKIGFNSNSQIVTWASKNQKEVKKLVSKFNVAPWYIEDGFIRSTGLGTDLTAPASIVLDKTGIYYDPSKPCDLENILQNKVFSSNELARSEALKNSFLENELSKYNLGNSLSPSVLDEVGEKKIILIPGQVEDDASILKGCKDINTNQALIKTVRKNEPDAFLIYKPHPDVVSGNRQGNVSNSIIQNNIDLLLADTSITDCLEVVDEVHTMTSLVGFEGLMRNLKVICYGLPFYSNWGLTEDKHKIDRRTRDLSLNELIAGTLIDYPLYMNWENEQLTTPEVVVAQLKKQIELQGGKQANEVPQLIRFGRKIKNFLKGVL